MNARLARAAGLEYAKVRRYKQEWIEEICFHVHHCTLEQLQVGLDRLMRGAHPFPAPDAPDRKWVPPARHY